MSYPLYGLVLLCGSTPDFCRVTEGDHRTLPIKYRMIRSQAHFHCLELFKVTLQPRARADSQALQVLWSIGFSLGLERTLFR